IDTIILTVLNLVLNYALVFGELGFPEMGIGGSALASTLAEIIAFIAFIIYILFDKKARTYRLFKIPNIDIQLVKQQLSISLPVVGQTVLALGSWFVFISLIESIGERPLAISNLIRIAYLILMIPCWGFSSGIHTLVSNVIGQKKIEEVIPLAFRTSVLSFVVTMCIAIPITVWPEVFLYPLLGSTNMSLIEESRPLFMILLGIISIYSVSTIFFNTIGGTGATDFTLKIQTVMTILYLMVVFLLVKYGNGGVEWAWAVEIFYWVVILVVSIWYLRTPRWHHYKV
ncbi:MAG TPA: MATE family efflux transporter, partial [Saprospiraceae bacterium]|nr:MATE family efflux transporter [Saprospiraceae bacterium]